MHDTSVTDKRLNLANIAQSLVLVQETLGELSRSQDADRDDFSNEIRLNMMAGYRCVDRGLAGGIDPLAAGSSKLVLELNNIVLYGTDPARRRRYLKSIRANEKRFYQKPEGGIGDIVDTYKLHRHESIWNVCSELYIHMLSQPQLFSEGNHRTGILIISFLLVRAGESPFVLSPENRDKLFHLSNALRTARTRSVRMLLKKPRLKRDLATLFREQANPDYLTGTGNQL